MPLSKLDDVSALIVIDLQKGILGQPLAHPTSDVLKRSLALAQAFRQKGLPVILVNVDGRPSGRTDAGSNYSLPPDWMELAPELASLPEAIRVTKQCWGAFTGTSLDAQLREHEVSQVIITGIATSIGVESTARAAYDLGYNVVLVADAMTDREAVAHEQAIQRVFPRLGEVVTTDEVLKRLG